MTKYKFTLQIDLGSDAMCRPQHLAEALPDVADQHDLVLHPLDYEPPGRDKVRDKNGNTVGIWRVLERREATSTR